MPNRIPVGATARQAAGQLAEAPIVDPRPGHRVTDHHEARVQAPEVVDTVVVERAALARSFERREVRAGSGASRCC